MESTQKNPVAQDISRPAQTKQAIDRASSENNNSIGQSLNGPIGSSQVVKQMNRYQELANQSVESAKITQFQQKANETVQLAKIGSLGDVRVDDTKYSNDNWGDIKKHMKGEWNKTNQGAPTGGHLLTSMVDEWGAATYSTNNERNENTDNSGVYFTKANNLPGKVSSQQHEWFLVDNTGQKKQSPSKSSSFWPKGWTEDDLKNTLDNSHTTNKGNTFASKENESYWYTWQTLGDKTVFPVARYAKMD